MNTHLPKSTIIQQAFSRAAESYDAHAVVQREAEDRLLEQLQAENLQPNTILELGCGPGRAAHRLKKRWPRARVLAVDLSPAMLERVRAGNGWLRKVETLCADARHLPLIDASVDLVFSNLMLQWVEQPAEVFAELRRVLRPGGLLLMHTLGPGTLEELRQSWRAVDDGVHVNPFVDMHHLGDALLGQGFQQVVVQAETLTLEYRQVRDLLRDLKGIGASNHLPQRQKGLMGKQAFARMQAAYERFRRADWLPASWELVSLRALAPEPGQPRRLPQGEEAGIPLEQLRAQLKRRKGPR